MEDLKNNPTLPHSKKRKENVHCFLYDNTDTCQGGWKKPVTWDGEREKNTGQREMKSQRKKSF